jgi:hypothetical protein
VSVRCRHHRAVLLACKAGLFGASTSAGAGFGFLYAGRGFARGGCFSSELIRSYLCNLLRPDLRVAAKGAQRRQESLHVLGHRMFARLVVARDAIVTASHWRSGVLIPRAGTRNQGYSCRWHAGSLPRG